MSGTPFWSKKLLFSAGNALHTVGLMVSEVRGPQDPVRVRCSVDDLDREEVELEPDGWPHIALGDDAALVWGQSILYLFPYVAGPSHRFVQWEPVWNAFQRDRYWILVREISVVVYDPVQSSEVTRFGLPDIPSQIWWQGDTLLVRDFNGMLLSFAWDSDKRQLSPVAVDQPDSPQSR